MNNSRRKEISEVMGVLEEIKEQLRAAEDQIQEIKDDEQDAFDSMPEQIQDGEQGQIMIGNIDSLDASVDYVDAAVFDINEILNSLSDAKA